MNPFRFYTILFLFIFSTNLFATDPPTNNSYGTATELTVQPVSCSSQTQGTLFNATNTNSDKTSSCINAASEYGIADYNDIWYKATVPSSGSLTIETSKVNAESDTILVVYILDGETLTEVGCNYNKGEEDNYSKVELTGQTQGTVIYIMVTDFASVSGGEGVTDNIPFNICAFDPDGTLDLPKFQKPLLSYYSNPVGNRLAVESPYQIQTLRVFDLMGKEVLHKTPNQQKLTLNTYTLAPGAYLLRVETAEGQQTVKLIKK